VSNEISYTRLATIHNLHFYLDLMRKIRLSLEEETFDPRALLIALGESLDIDGSPLNS
jgi:tRNA-guanine family transglycosylase